MQTRTLGQDLNVSAMGLGCMGMSEFYGPRDDDAGRAALDHAIDLGINFLDTADMYGPHHNETLLGGFLASRRADVRIATKFGIVRQPGEYARTLDNSAAYARTSCEGSLRRLGIDCIDLYYVHRVDVSRPIEDTMRGLVALVEAGKIARIGLCEVNAETLRRAHAIHPISAVQSEYSLWTRDVEAEVLPACRELGIGFVPYSPLGRGFLTGRFQSSSDFDAGDFRENLPRFSEHALQINRQIVDVISELALQKSCTPAQLALAWLLAQGPDIVPIPGSRQTAHISSNAQALDITLSNEECRHLEHAVARLPVAGARYTAEGMKGVMVR